MTTAVTYRGKICQLEQVQPPFPHGNDIIFQHIMTSDADALDRISDAIQERRFSLGIGKFSKSLIYLVRAIDTGVVAYVGSTTRPMKVRWGGHESFFKNNPFSKWTKYVMEHGGVQNFRIELVEEYPCRSLHELLEREKYFIHTLDPVCNIVMRAEEPGLVLHDCDSISIDPEEPKRWGRKYISPAASFRGDCLSYDRLQDISSDVCMKILDNNKLRKSSEFEVLTACKHIFDNHIVESRTELDHRRIVFDKAMRNKQSRRVLVNTTLWKDKRRINLLEELYGSENPFKPSYRDVDGVLGLIGQVTEQLGMSSFCDSKTIFTSSLLSEKLAILQPIVKSLTHLLGLSDSIAKAPLKALSGNLRKIFLEMSGIELSSVRKVIRDGGNWDKIYSYQLDTQKF